MTFEIGDRVRYVGTHPYFVGKEGVITGPRMDRPPGYAWCVSTPAGHQFDGIVFSAGAENLVLIESAAEQPPDSLGPVLLDSSNERTR